MFSGIIISIEHGAQIFGEVDFEKLSAIIDQLLPQIKQGAEQQRKDRLIKLLREVDKGDLEIALQEKAS